MTCPCQSQKDFAVCCEPYITGAARPETAELLMRSRYTAYALGNLEYIKDTLAPEARKDFNVSEAKKWSEKSKWLGLKILETQAGGANDNKGVVEFIAKYSTGAMNAGEVIDHHEVAQFRKEKGNWVFVDGDAHTHKDGEGHHHHHGPPKDPVVREMPKVGRNDPCSCGSGKKYKKCCAV